MTGRSVSIWFLIISFFCNSLFSPHLSYSQELIDNPSKVPMIQGLKVDLKDPLNLDFIVDQGSGHFSDNELKAESQKMVKYFLALLTIPQGELWVNLSPYEKDHIIPAQLGITQAGKDMLVQDYLLKQLTSSLTHPETVLGKEFWHEVYQKALQLYGNTDKPINTFNKVWIVPDKAVVYQKNDSVIIIESHLKVMLEEDYTALSKNPRTKGKDISSTAASEIVRRIILPRIEEEVNTGPDFASLRQIYNAFILAVWYKRNLKQGLLNAIYTDKKKMGGIDIQDKKAAEKIYRQYIQSFKKGVYNLIKESDETGAMVPRKYFSGGVDLTQEMGLGVLPAIPQEVKQRSLLDVKIHLQGIDLAMTSVPPQKPEHILFERLKKILDLMEDGKFKKAKLPLAEALVGYSSDLKTVADLIGADNFGGAQTALSALSLQYSSEVDRLVVIEAVTQAIRVLEVNARQVTASGNLDDINKGLNQEINKQEQKVSKLREHETAAVENWVQDIDEKEAALRMLEAQRDELEKKPLPRLVKLKKDLENSQKKTDPYNLLRAQALIPLIDQMEERQRVLLNGVKRNMESIKGKMRFETQQKEKLSALLLQEEKLLDQYKELLAQSSGVQLELGRVVTRDIQKASGTLKEQVAVALAVFAAENEMASSVPKPVLSAPKTIPIRILQVHDMIRLAPPLVKDEELRDYVVNILLAVTGETPQAVQKRLFQLGFVDEQAFILDRHNDDLEKDEYKRRALIVTNQGLTQLDPSLGPQPISVDKLIMILRNQEFSILLKREGLLAEARKEENPRKRLPILVAYLLKDKSRSIIELLKKAFVGSQAEKYLDKNFAMTSLVIEDLTKFTSLMQEGDFKGGKLALMDAFRRFDQDAFNNIAGLIDTNNFRVAKQHLDKLNNEYLSSLRGPQGLSLVDYLMIAVPLEQAIRVLKYSMHHALAGAEAENLEQEMAKDLEDQEAILQTMKPQVDNLIRILEGEIDQRKVQEASLQAKKAVIEERFSLRLANLEAQQQELGKQTDHFSQLKAAAVLLRMNQIQILHQSEVSAIDMEINVVNEEIRQRTEEKEDMGRRFTNEQEALKKSLDALHNAQDNAAFRISIKNIIVQRALAAFNNIMHPILKDIEELKQQEDQFQQAVGEITPGDVAAFTRSAPSTIVDGKLFDHVVTTILDAIGTNTPKHRKAVEERLVELRIAEDVLIEERQKALQEQSPIEQNLAAVSEQEIREFVRENHEYLTNMELLEMLTDHIQQKTGATRQRTLGRLRELNLSTEADMERELSLISVGNNLAGMTADQTRDLIQKTETAIHKRGDTVTDMEFVKLITKIIRQSTNASEENINRHLKVMGVDVLQERQKVLSLFVKDKTPFTVRGILGPLKVKVIQSPSRIDGYDFYDDGVIKPEIAQRMTEIFSQGEWTWGRFSKEHLPGIYNFAVNEKNVILRYYRAEGVLAILIYKSEDDIHMPNDQSKWKTKIRTYVGGFATSGEYKHFNPDLFKDVLQNNSPAANKAMVTSLKNTGGIDLNENMLDLKVQGGSSAADFSGYAVGHGQITGFKPVVTAVILIKDLVSFLNLAT